jgi:hypothetical protein
VKTSFYGYAAVIIGMLLCGGTDAKGHGNTIPSTVVCLHRDSGFLLGSPPPGQSVRKLMPFTDAAVHVDSASVPPPGIPSEDCSLSATESLACILEANLDDDHNSSDEGAVLPHNSQLAVCSCTLSVKPDVFPPNSSVLLPTRPPP